MLDDRPPAERNKFRDKQINKMAAVGTWTVLIIFLALGVAVAARVFAWIWP